MQRGQPRRTDAVRHRRADFDPEPVFATVSCPVLLCYGETDAWTPIEESVTAWRRAARGADLTVARLAGCDHAPTLHEGDTVDSISPQYEKVLLDWLDGWFATAG